MYLESGKEYLAHGEFGNLARRAASLVWSETAGVVVCKDLTLDPERTGRGKGPEIRQASITDVQSLVGEDHDANRDATDLWERRLRRHIADALGADGCYVADIPGVGTAFMQYLFTARDSTRLEAEFPGLFPAWTNDRAITEFLYVARESRTPGFAVNCLLQVADEARLQGGRSVISFINPSNQGALFVNHLAGYRAESIRRSKRRFFRTKYIFEDWPANISTSLAELASGRVKIS